jgi:hypothetical protein
MIMIEQVDQDVTPSSKEDIIRIIIEQVDQNVNSWGPGGT